MVQLLLEDVTLIKGDPVAVKVRFKGGATGSLSVPRNLASYETWTTDQKVVDEIDREVQAMVLEDGFKVLRDLRRGTAELYDLSADPGEIRNLYEDGGLSQPHLEALDRFFAVHTLREGGYEPPFRPP